VNRYHIRGFSDRCFHYFYVFFPFIDIDLDIKFILLFTSHIPINNDHVNKASIVFKKRKEKKIRGKKYICYKHNSFL